MKKPALPSNEETRLSQLIAYKILDTDSEKPFDDLTELASIICGVPIAVVSLVDKDRQWFKSAFGLNAKETPRDISFCAHAIHEPTVMKVSDALLDPRFSDNPLVIDGPKVRFYAGAPLITPSGHAIGTLCVIDQKPGDLTEKQTEALSALARQVVHLFELRIKTQEIFNHCEDLKKYASLVAEQKQQLFYSSKMASMGEMATGLAHEINNPLAIILGRLERLLDTSQNGLLEPAQTEKSLQAMIQTGQRISTIIRGLRSFARDGASDPKENIFIRTIIDETYEMMSHRFKNENIKVKISCPKDLTAWGVPVQTSQILINLISNSIDAIRNLPDRWIHVEASPKTAGVLIRITDCGKGLEAEIQEKIMEPFFTTKPVGQGTGLGLSISKGLAESMGGTLRLDITHKNTSFEIWLPQAPAKSQAA